MGEEQKELTLEEAFEELEKSIHQLEQEDLSLEDAFSLYKKGMDTLKYCNDTIDQVEKKILSINGDGEINEF